MEPILVDLSELKTHSASRYPEFETYSGLGSTSYSGLGSGSYSGYGPESGSGSTYSGSGSGSGSTYSGSGSGSGSTYSGSGSGSGSTYSGSGSGSGSTYSGSESGLRSGSGSEFETSDLEPKRIHFEPEYLIIISEYSVAFSTRDCGFGIGLLKGYYDTDFTPQKTLEVEIEQVCS